MPTSALLDGETTTQPIGISTPPIIQLPAIPDPRRVALAPGVVDGRRGPSSRNPWRWGRRLWTVRAPCHSVVPTGVLMLRRRPLS